MKEHRSRNCSCRGLFPDVHVAVAGLAVVEVAAADDTTAAFATRCRSARCAIAPADAADGRSLRPASNCALRLTGRARQ
ncbi:DUF6207 family protein [Streptomyces sp. NPDC014006]|uniref:DUF6207 family protein n=1 Tax=Streptomyces sp. NPDC014006 TaxID=3364870 RepID=UPI0036FDF81A